MTSPQNDLFDAPPEQSSSASLFERMQVALQHSTNPYAKKDLQKAATANKFIGRGSSASSTNRYRQAAGDLANCGWYQASDVVFVSAEGARRQRLNADLAELSLAAKAGATFVTDTFVDRERPYNVGEREVSAFLVSLGYCDDGKGFWRRP